MKTLLSACVLGCFLLAGWTIAEPPADDTQDQPVRLKKKKKADKPEAAPEKPEPKPEKPPETKPKPKLDEDAGLDPRDDVKLPQNEQEDEENDILRRLARNSRLSEEKLAKRETGEGTRKLQEEILKDLDRLLEQSKQNQQNQGQQGQQGEQGQESKSGGGSGGGSGGSAGQQPQGGQTPQQRAQERAERRKQRSGSRQTAQRPQGGQENQPGQKSGQDSDGKNDRGNSSGKKDPANPDKKFDLWGHLPEKERALMNKEMEARFMEKYDELTKQYYRTIAEKSRKKYLAIDD